MRRPCRTTRDKINTLTSILTGMGWAVPAREPHMSATFEIVAILHTSEHSKIMNNRRKG
jgi:hypothetical protein